MVLLIIILAITIILMFISNRNLKNEYAEYKENATNDIQKLYDKITCYDNKISDIDALDNKGIIEELDTKKYVSKPTREAIKWLLKTIEKIEWYECK